MGGKSDDGSCNLRDHFVWDSGRVCFLIARAGETRVDKDPSSRKNESAFLNRPLVSEIRLTHFGA